jgi:uncharacterized protein YigA (DUF484 family)
LDRPKDKSSLDKSGIGKDGAAALRSERDLSDAEVAAYLRRHPDFLARHPDLLTHLTPPEMQRGEGVYDMQFFMLQRLRHEVTRLKGQQRALIATSRSNLTSQQRVHAAVLALLSATSFEQLLQVVTTDLAVLLDVDVVTIGVETAGLAQPRLPMAGILLLAGGTVDQLLGSDRDALLRSSIVGDPMLFGGGAGLVRSDALLRLSVSEHAPAGLLCLGTRRSDKFHPGQGTELLTFLARTLEVTIAAWLDLAA